MRIKNILQSNVLKLIQNVYFNTQKSTTPPKPEVGPLINDHGDSNKPQEIREILNNQFSLLNPF